MKVHTPLQGTRLLFFHLIGILMFFAILSAPNTYAQENASDQYLRQIQVTLENTIQSVQNVSRIFSSLDRDLSVAGSMREINQVIGNMTSSAQQLERIFSAFLNDSNHDPTKRDFANALQSLGDSALRLQALLQPQNISRVQDVNLRDVHFAINNIISSVERLKRLLNASNDNTPTPPDRPNVTLEQISLTFRHIVGNIHKAQTATHSIDPGGTANRESLREVLGFLRDAQEETTKFSRMLRAYGTTSDEKLQILRNMIQISDQISSELNRLLQGISPGSQTTRVASQDIEIEKFNAALDLIKGQLRDLHRGLKALLGAANDESADAEPGDALNNALQRFDTNGDCIITTEEILNALELWVAKQIDHRLFMTIVDAWVTGVPVCVTTDPLSSASGASAVELKTSQSVSGIAFRAQDANVLTTEVEIFDTHGQAIATERAHGSRLIWNLRDGNGRQVANGVYFYSITFHTNDGSVIRNEIRKLIFVR